MGKKPDDIEREIAEKRATISRRVEGLQTRVQEDVDAVRADAKNRSSQAFDDAKQSLKVDNLKQMVEDHTLSSMAGAVGVGVLLGVVSEGLGSGNGRNGGGNRREYDPGGSYGSSNGGGIGSMLGSLMGPAASTAQNELQSLVREGFATLKGQVQQVGHEDKRVENRDVGVQ